VQVDVWADNWFALYANGALVLEDSVPITTERSFNAESDVISITFPAQIAFVVKDFKENDTGLEYIGSRKQQMGDGGFIAQFWDASSGTLLGATSSAVRCLVVHHAPLQKSCAQNPSPVAGQEDCGFTVLPEPPGWTEAGFDDSAWPRAQEYAERDVRPKDGYDRIRWDRSARLIWSGDLVQDNTLLCRMTLQR
jgi:hypothetical protein